MMKPLTTNLKFTPKNLGPKSPYYGILDQLINKYRKPKLNGLICDEKGSLPAQLVEQPCGVFSTGGDVTFSEIDLSNKNKVSIYAVTKRTASNGVYAVEQYDSSAMRIALAGYTDGRLYAVVCNGSSTSYGSIVLDNTTFKKLLMVYDGTQSTNAEKLKLFVDGVEQTLAFNGNIPTSLGDISGDDFGIGRHDTTNPNASIVDVRVYDDAITWEQLDSADKMFWCPNPAIPYDIVNGYYGTIAGTVTEGTQDESAVIQSVGFNKYLKCLTNGVIGISNNITVGTFEVDLYQPIKAKRTTVYFLSENIGLEADLQNAESVGITTDDSAIVIRRNPTSVVWNSNDDVTPFANFYRLRLELTATAYVFSIKGGSYGWSDWTQLKSDNDTANDGIGYTVVEADPDCLIGNMKYTDADGNIRWLSDDINDWHIFSGTWENHLVPADLSAPTYDVLGNPLHYLPKGIMPLGAIDMYSGFQGLLASIVGYGSVSGLATEVTYDGKECVKLLGSYTSADRLNIVQQEFINGTTMLVRMYVYIVSAETPTNAFSMSNGCTGAILDKGIRNKWHWLEGYATATGDFPGIGIRVYEGFSNVGSEIYIDRSSVYSGRILSAPFTEESNLELYDRFAVIDNQLSKGEYWKEEIQLIESFDYSNPYRHDLDELTNIDYIRVFGTQLLIQRLFLKAFKTDSDWTAISNILNYSEVLDSTKRDKVIDYLKDPSKSNQEAWELYQASTVVAAYRFDQPLSVFNEDGELCKLGWEGEDVIANGGFDADTDWDKVDSATISGGTLNCQSGDAISGARQTGVVDVGNKYYLEIEIVSITTGYVNVYLGQAIGSGLAIDGETSAGVYRVVFDVPSGLSDDEIFIYGFLSDAKIDNVILYKVGDTVAKVLDVGSGGVDGLTYYNLTQSDLSLQPKRVAGGLEFDDADNKRLILSETNTVNATNIKLTFKTTQSTEAAMIAGVFKHTSALWGCVTMVAGQIAVSSGSSTCKAKTNNTFNDGEEHTCEIQYDGLGNGVGSWNIIVDGVAQALSIATSNRVSTKVLVGCRYSGSESLFYKGILKDIIII